jgi:hypothetical protein
MAIGNTGLLGAAAISSGTGSWTKLYTCPTGFSAAVEVNFNNTGSLGAKYSWAISSQAATPAAAEIRETNSALSAGSPICVTTSVGPGQSVFVQSSTGGLNALVNGFEESTS